MYVIFVLLSAMSYLYFSFVRCFLYVLCLNFHVYCITNKSLIYYPCSMTSCILGSAGSTSLNHSGCSVFICRVPSTISLALSWLNFAPRRKARRNRLSISLITETLNYYVTAQVMKKV